VVEPESVKTLLNAACHHAGGGWDRLIAVVRASMPVRQRTTRFASSLLAREINADLFVISTAVEKVAINFGKPEEKWLDSMTLAEAKSIRSKAPFCKGPWRKDPAVIWFPANPNAKALPPILRISAGRSKVKNT
jgi:carbamate kinase